MFDRIIIFVMATLIIILFVLGLGVVFELLGIPRPDCFLYALITYGVLLFFFLAWAYYNVKKGL